jgi:outer membrane protein OmpA-like peptidoglycan-associated protein
MGGIKQGLAFLALGVSLATAAWAQEVEREGVIISKSEGNLNVRTREGNLTVVVTPSTEIREVAGAVGLQRRTRDAQTLIPGLIIKAEGNLSGDTLTAEEIEFRERDWRAAIAARGGTQAELAELRQAIIEGQEYVIRDETTVYFASGSTAIAEQYRTQLRQLAQNASSHGNYRISILGYADPRGNPEANERLSLRRAAAVSNFLRQTGSIQPGRVLSPTAMGEGALAPGDTAPASDAEARRVVVRVVTPKTQLTE